jgi:hypothetical protein
MGKRVKCEFVKYIAELMVLIKYNRCDFVLCKL